jgi:hypothetical protein
MGGLQAKQVGFLEVNDVGRASCACLFDARRLPSCPLLCVQRLLLRPRRRA